MSTFIISKRWVILSVISFLFFSHCCHSASLDKVCTVSFNLFRWKSLQHRKSHQSQLEVVSVVLHILIKLLLSRSLVVAFQLQWPCHYTYLFRMAFSANPSLLCSLYASSSQSFNLNSLITQVPKSLNTVLLCWSGPVSLAIRLSLIRTKFSSQQVFPSQQCRPPTVALTTKSLSPIAGWLKWRGYPVEFQESNGKSY